jgi:phospholipase/carboxylesterase
MGRQWFPVSWLDGCAETEMEAGFRRSVDILDRYITEAMAEEGVGPAQTALVGFSQGTMMSLYVAPRRPEQLAGVVGFSGRLLEGENLADEALTKPPLLLIHGDQDEMIPLVALHEAQTALVDAGFEVRSHISRGIGHGIAPDGLGLALGFLAEHLATDAE